MQSIKRRDDLNTLLIQVLPKMQVVSRIQLTKMPVVLSTAHPHNRLV